MMDVNETKKSQLMALLSRCIHLEAEIRTCAEQGYFTVTVPPPWNIHTQEEAQRVQQKVREWSKQYPHVVCYCFDSFSTLLYVL